MELTNTTSLLANSKSGFHIVTDTELNILNTNRAVRLKTGYSESELMGMAFPSLYQGDYRQKVIQFFQEELYLPEGRIVHPWTSKHGKFIAAELSVTHFFVGQQKCFIISGSDYVEKAITEIIDNSDIVLLLWRNEPDWPIEFVSENAKKIFGYSNSSFINQLTPYSSLIHPEDLERVTQEVQNAIKSNTPAFSHKPYRIIRADKQVRWVADYTNVRRNKKGEALSFEGLIIDITKQKEAELKAEKAEKRFVAMVNNISDSVFMTDQAGNIIDCNKYAHQELGYTREELLNLHVRDINVVDKRANFKEVKDWLENKSDRHEFETLHLTKSGKQIPVEVSASIFEYENKVFFLSVARNVTEKKKIEAEIKESEEQLLKLQETAKIASWQLDILNGNLSCSKEFYSIFGIANLPMSSDKDFLKLIHEQDQKTVETAWQKALLGATFDIKYRLKVNHKIKWVHEIAEMKFNKQGIAVKASGLIHDITETKLAALELKAKKDNYLALAEEYHLQNESLQKAKEKAEENDRLKSSFLANMSHEIRTPMNGILGFSQLLSEPGISKDQQQRFVKIISDSGQQLLNIVNDILDISKLETGQAKVFLHKINLTDLMQKLHAEFKIQADKNANRFVYKKNSNIKRPLYIHTDEGKLKQILNNLLSNAIKFTNEGSVEYGFSIKNNTIEFFVTDTGIGIPEEKISSIFERFQQADITISRQFGGTGLGLAIAKANVLLLGGDIWVKSTVQKRTTFFFNIPLKKDNLPLHKPTEEVQKNKLYDWTNKTILITEDEAINFILLEEILSATGVNILKATTGKAALELALQKPDIILMDIKLPDINGYQVVKKIRYFAPKIPIIAQTAFAMEGDKSKVIAAGFNDYISKPIEAKLLLTMIDKYLYS